MTRTGRQQQLRRRALAGSLLLLVVVVLVATSALPHRDDVLSLPDRVAGLRPAPAAAGADDVAARLVDRLRAQSTVAAVGLGRYGDEGASVVVLKVLPREVFTEETAGRLTAQLLTELQPSDGATAARESAPSADGRALLSCRESPRGASTCVSVEAAQALVVLATGWDGDLLGLAEDVRRDLGPASTG